MSKTNSLYDQILSLYATFEEEHAKNAGGNKAAGSRARKALGEIKNTVVDIALKASEKVIKRNLNNEDNKKMIEQTVKEFKEVN